MSGSAQGLSVVQNFITKKKKIGLIRWIQLSGFNQIIGLVQTDNQCFFQLASVPEEWQNNQAISGYMVNTCDIYKYNPPYPPHKVQAKVKSQQHHWHNGGIEWRFWKDCFHNDLFIKKKKKQQQETGIRKLSKQQSLKATSLNRRCTF